MHKNFHILNYRLLTDKWTSLNLNALIEKAIIEISQAKQDKKWNENENLMIFVKSYQNFFDEINKYQILSVLDTKPVLLLEDIIPARNFDISFKHLTINQKTDVLNMIIERLQKIMITSTELCRDFQTKELTDNFYPLWKEGILGIIYTEKVIPKDLYSKEKFYRLWNTIIESFNQLTNSVIQGEIIQTDCCSTIMKLEPITIQTMIDGLREALDGYKKILEIKKIQLEVEQLNLNAKEAILEILNNEINTEVDSVCNTVAENLSIYFKHSGPEAETIKWNIKVALKHLINFIEKGGNLISDQSLQLNELIDKINNIITNISLIKPYSKFFETVNTN